MKRSYDKKVSAQVLNAIVFGTKHTETDCQISKKDWVRLRQTYECISHDLVERGVEQRPRNLPFYIAARQNYPEFSWKELVCEGRNPQFAFRFPGTGKPTLLDMILNRVPMSSTLDVRNRVSQIVETLLSSISWASSETSVIKAVQPWLTKLVEGQPSTLVTPVCPDYAAVRSENGKFRYTFDSLGDGIGVVGHTILENYQPFFDLQGEFLNLTLVAIGGDFEAFDSSNCNNLGVDETEFIRRVEIGQKKLGEAASGALLTPCFMDICANGKTGWLELVRDFRAAIERELAAEDPIRQREFEAVVSARAPLYKRWFQYEYAAGSAIRQKVIDQGAEYAAIGELIGTAYENPLILGADHKAMLPFYRFSNTPAVYVERDYE